MAKKSINIRAIIFSILLVLILFVVIPAFQQLIAHQVTSAWQKGYDAGLAARKLSTIEEIQERIGAKPDGKWGPETEKLYDQAICNQFAVECFEKQLAKEKE